MAIQLVGGASGGLNNSSASTYNISLSALTGGIASSPSAGDIIIVVSGWASTTNGDPGVTTAGYTEIADLYSNDDHDVNMSVSYLVISGTPPTSVTVSASGVSGNNSAATVGVFRGVDNTTPLDVTTTTATGFNGTDFNPAAITPITSGAWVVATGMSAGLNSGTYTAASGYTEIADIGTGSSGTRNSSSGIFYKAWTSGVEDPGTFTNSTGGTGASWASATIALRPSIGNIKYWNGSSWLSKPVKYWNGSAWVKKPLKRWNGSAWVTTNY